MSGWEWGEPLVYALSPIVFFFFGRKTVRREHTSERLSGGQPVYDPKPICQCSHGFAVHAEEGSCGSITTERVLVERGSPHSVKSGMYGDSYKVVYDIEKWESHERACPCRRYTGPEPMPTMVAL